MSVPQPASPFAGMAITQAQATAARKQLELLATHSRDPHIKELARDVIAGKRDLRSAMLGARYEDALNEGMASFSEWHKNLSDSERAEQERQAGEYLETLQQEVAQVQPRRAHRSVGGDDGWEPPDTILTDRPIRR